MTDAQKTQLTSAQQRILDELACPQGGARFLPQSPDLPMGTRLYDGNKKRAIEKLAELGLVAYTTRLVPYRVAPTTGRAMRYQTTYTVTSLGVDAQSGLST
jgi:hypothetical protein